MERVRKIDVNSLSEQELKNLEDTLSKKILDISEKATAEANKYLNIYFYLTRWNHNRNQTFIPNIYTIK